MLTFYTSVTCPFSKKVLEVADEMGLTYETKDISDLDNEAELLRLGGEVQTPYMVDSEHGVSMYNSDDIIPYLHKTFG